MDDLQRTGLVRENMYFSGWDLNNMHLKVGRSKTNIIRLHYRVLLLLTGDDHQEYRNFR